MPDLPTSGTSLRVSTAGDGSVLALTGPLTLETTEPLWGELEKLRRSPPSGPLSVDLSQVGSCDTAGVTFLLALRDDLDASLTDPGEGVRALLGLADRPDVAPDALPPRPRSGIIAGTGNFALHVIGNMRESIIYIGQLAGGLFGVVLRPRGVRWRDVGTYMSRAGADAVGIVALINCLLGFTLALQSVAQLGKYGLASLTAEAVAAAVVGELGPLMTAIIVAGRSGSGFAAEIGTMQVNEEVSALDTLGLDRTRFLVVPKVLALLLVMPLLVIIADLSGVFGGLLIGTLSLDLSIESYVQKSLDAVGLREFFEGLVKAQCYAIVVAAVGCLRGLQTRKGAQGVGTAATSAVVTGIFLIICVDALLTIIFQTLHAL